MATPSIGIIIRAATIINTMRAKTFIDYSPTLIIKLL